MARGFRRRRDGATAITLEAFESALLRDCAEQLLDLLGPDDAPAADPVAAAFHRGPSEAPEDPALARLFPDAYGDGDDEARAASAEFRRFTEPDLRTRKRSDALAVIASLETAADAGRRGVEVSLDAAQCRQWLGTLNDLRLTLASRLGLAAEGDDRALLGLPDDDPRKATASVYFWLTWLQDGLVESLAG